MVKGVEKEELPHDLSEVNSSVTISIGICTAIPTKEFSLNTLFNYADIALYKAKETGRNRYYNNNILRFSSSTEFIVSEITDA